MNFVQLLNSVDELLYEVMSWVIFYPVTLWRAIVRPLESMRYAEAQLALPEDAQFAETLSPPVFLVITLVITQAIGFEIDGANPIVADRTGVGALIGDNTALVALRAVVFGLFPVFLAAQAVRARRLPLTRASLRPFFFAQCLVTTPFALFTGIGAAMAEAPDAALHAPGLWLLAGGALMYLLVELRWFAAELDRGWARAALAVGVGIGQSLGLLLLIAFILTL